MNDSVKYLLALHCITNMTALRLTSLMKYFNHDAERAWQETALWQHVDGITTNQAVMLAKGRDMVDVESVYEHFMDSYASLMIVTDPQYPSLLSEIYDPPYLFFYYGQMPQAEELTVAMIGSRSPSNYGLQVASVLSREVAAQGIWVVAGMARGLDSACHEGAIAAEGRTIAVLGSGLDVIYPPEKADLYRDIIDHGAVISEFPFGAAPDKRHFPIRNRIISGLSRGVVVIEAGRQSGTLITVDRAMEQNRDIFAVPGRIDSNKSVGTNALIAQGAKLVACGKDIWGEYLPEDYQPPQRLEDAPKAETAVEEQILELMNEPIQLDELLDKLGLTAQELLPKLTILEMKGLISVLAGKYYVRKLHKL